MTNILSSAFTTALWLVGIITAVAIFFGALFIIVLVLDSIFDVIRGWRKDDGKEG